MSRRRYRLSISIQLIVVMTLLVAGVIGTCIFVNNRYLVRYYEHQKESEMREGYALINEAEKNGTLTGSDFDIPFEKICSNGNLGILIISGRRNILRSSISNFQDYQMELIQILMDPTDMNLEILENNDSYTLLRRTDNRLNSDYLILVGTLSCGDMIYMRTALESIWESAAITNKFFTWIGIALGTLSILVILILAMTISRPIKNLTHLSKQMAGLDFDAKYSGSLQDAREIGELGEHMNELSETLEKTISELKRANNELMQDIRKKEEIDEMRKEFLSNVSHELKTPIALISGYAEGLKECINDDAESREFYCDVIMDESEKMGAMVKKLLTLNQLEFGNDTVDMERFDLTELIRGVVDANILPASQNGISVNFDADAPVYVWADAFKIEEVVTNYLSNAIHYAAGDRQVTVTCEKRDQLVRVTVFNTGSQIPEDELDKIWIKFYKVDKARTREYGGNGIGLSIVKAIMDSHNRNCGVCNRENGVEFWFELELA